MKNFKEFFIEMSGRALGKASDDFKNRSKKTIEKIESLTKLTNLKDLEKENNVYSFNKKIKKNKFYKKKFYKKKVK